jgi:hypothetical protein
MAGAAQIVVGIILVLVGGFFVVSGYLPSFLPVWLSSCWESPSLCGDSLRGGTRISSANPRLRRQTILRDGPIYLADW